MHNTDKIVALKTKVNVNRQKEKKIIDNSYFVNDLIIICSVRVSYGNAHLSIKMIQIREKYILE